MCASQGKELNREEQESDTHFSLLFSDPLVV